MPSGELNNITDDALYLHGSTRLEVEKQRRLEAVTERGDDVAVPVRVVLTPGPADVCDVECLVDGLDGEALLGDAVRASDVHDLEHRSSHGPNDVREDGRFEESGERLPGEGADASPRGIPQELSPSNRLNIVLDV